MKKLLVSIALILSFALSACGSTNDETAVNEISAEVRTEPTNETEAVANAITQGTYKVGVDIKAGEYLIIATSLAGYIEAAEDSTGALDSIIFNENIFQGSHTYATLSNGQHFKLQGAKMYPAARAPSVIPENGIYKDGMYKVGQDIPPGQYKISLDSDMGISYIEVAKDSNRKLTSIVANANLQADTHLTVSSGQYLTLIGAYIEIK